MYSTKALLFVAALAGTSLSQKSDSEFCSAQLESIFSLVRSPEAPTTPAAILSFIATNTQVPPLPTTLDPEGHQSQLCALATALPSSLLPEFQTLAAELISFGKVHSNDFIAYITDCVAEENVASTTNYLNYIFTATGNICTETGICLSVKNLGKKNLADADATSICNRYADESLILAAIRAVAVVRSLGIPAR
ncbi:hypothetical protein NUW58_g2066 [Xylaria curta]|uniref:Uncharacterized protein n=1 Tax=Xylaria curta TaxID=42375 RepID=A0ACC1PHW7_9PEZI|nr:hypothetical protein NUW58_g2066 [Xylaria curta]